MEERGAGMGQSEKQATNEKQRGQAVAMVERLYQVTRAASIPADVHDECERIKDALVKGITDAPQVPTET